MRLILPIQIKILILLNRASAIVRLSGSSNAIIYFCVCVLDEFTSFPCWIFSFLSWWRSNIVNGGHTLFQFIIWRISESARIAVYETYLIFTLRFYIFWVFDLLFYLFFLLALFHRSALDRLVVWGSFERQMIGRMWNRTRYWWVEESIVRKGWFDGNGKFGLGLFHYK